MGPGPGADRARGRTKVGPCAMDRPGCPRPSSADSLHALFCLAVRRWQSAQSSRGVSCYAPVLAVPSLARGRQGRDRHLLGDLLVVSVSSRVGASVCLDPEQKVPHLDAALLGGDAGKAGPHSLFRPTELVEVSCGDTESVWFRWICFGSKGKGVPAIPLMTLAAQSEAIRRQERAAEDGFPPRGMKRGAMASLCRRCGCRRVFRHR